MAKSKTLLFIYSLEDLHSTNLAFTITLCSSAIMATNCEKIIEDLGWESVKSRAGEPAHIKEIHCRIKMGWSTYG